MTLNSNPVLESGANDIQPARRPGRAEETQMDAQDFADVLSAVRAFVREQVIPREDEIERTDEIPPDVREAARRMGLFGYALPEAYGGLGLSLGEEVRLAFEL